MIFTFFTALVLRFSSRFHLDQSSTGLHPASHRLSLALHSGYLFTTLLSLLDAIIPSPLVNSALFRLLHYRRCVRVALRSGSSLQTLYEIGRSTLIRSNTVASPPKAPTCCQKGN